MNLALVYLKGHQPKRTLAPPLLTLEQLTLSLCSLTVLLEEFSLAFFYSLHQALTLLQSVALLFAANNFLLLPRPFHVIRYYSIHFSIDPNISYRFISAKLCVIFLYLIR